MPESRWLHKRVIIYSIILATFLPQSAAGAVIQEGEVHWQLYNFATEYKVRIRQSGAIQLIHAQTNTFICFNRRRRITVRMTGMSPRCHFYERINDLGFTELESAAEPGLFLGFNSRGRFQDPSIYQFKRKPFSWIKFERYVPFRELQACVPRRRMYSPPPPPPPPNFRAVLRASLLEKVRATHNGPYNSYEGSGNYILP